MKVAGSIALVTGANRGLGLAFAKALVEMGAAKVYAAARNPEAVTLKGVVPLKLDVTSDEDVVAAARAAENVNLLINNAGIARPGGFLADGAVEAAREQFEVNFGGPLRMARAFAPVLAKNGGGAIINVLSVARLHRLTSTISIVFTQVSDPIGSGYVASLARPGGNITGFQSYDPPMGGKWLGVLKEAAPNLSNRLRPQPRSQSAGVQNARCAFSIASL
jgi:NAD(P)-dependent dehydrogenase (short-subunit alcohol dehydrogenase family)